MARSDARCSIGWWVGPSSPRPTESWVHEKTTLASRQGGEAHRGPHVVAEHEERAADRQRRRRAAPCRSSPRPCRARGRRSGSGGRRGRRRVNTPWSLSAVPVLPVRSAPPPMSPGTTSSDRVEARAAAPCGWRPSRPASHVGSFVLPAGRARGRSRHGLVGLAVAVPRGAAASPTPRARRGPARPALAVELEHVVGHEERLVGRQAEDLLGGRDLVLAERVAVGLGGVGELGRRVADVAAQHDQRRAVLDGHRPRAAPASSASRSLATSPSCVDVPAVGLEALGRRRRCSASSVGPSMRDVVVVVDVDEAAEAEVAGERRGLVADALLEVAVAADHERVVVARPRGRSGPAGSARRCAMPTPLAKPWPSGPVVTSTPAVWWTSGWPGRLRAPLAEVAQVVERQAVAR